MSTKGCCGKCGDFAFGLDTASKKDNCECHQDTKQGWEERVCLCGQDIMAVQEPAVHTDNYCGPLKDLIQKEISLAVEKERNEIVEGLEGMEEKCDFCNREYPDPNCHKATKNQTILDALSLIRNRNKGV